MDDELDMEEREKTHTKYLNKIMDILENDRRAIIKEIGIKKLELLIKNNTQNFTTFKIPDLNMRDLFTISTTGVIDKKNLIININIPITQRKCQTLYKITSPSTHEKYYNNHE